MISMIPPDLDSPSFLVVISRISVNASDCVFMAFSSVLSMAPLWAFNAAFSMSCLLTSR